MEQELLTINTLISQNRFDEAIHYSSEEKLLNLSLLLREIQREFSNEVVSVPNNTQKSTGIIPTISKPKKVSFNIMDDNSDTFPVKSSIKESSGMDQVITQSRSSPVKSNNNTKTVKLLCNWCSSQELAQLWGKMSQGDNSWSTSDFTLKLTCEDKADYYVIINQPPQGEYYDEKKTIFFQMEHLLDINMISKPFLYMGTYPNKAWNNGEWHLSKTYQELIRESERVSKTKILSAILSGKYSDPGHIKRVDFVKFIEKKWSKSPLHIDVFGENKFNYTHFQGSLPYHQKDDGLFPYKYHVTAENHSIPYYYTEKLIDGILSETLVFYWGCPNIRELIDPRAYVQLHLSNFEEDFKIVEQAIREDWWTQRLPYIRAEKVKILNELQFFPRISGIIGEDLRREG